MFLLMFLFATKINNNDQIQTSFGGIGRLRRELGKLSTC
jgi:hypothetical protein